jgi:diacylglycerol kinase family enzyme
VFTKKSGDGTTLTRKIIAIGGDGTINEVANGFFCVENRLAIYVTNIENNNNNADAVFNSMMVKALNSGHNVPSGTRNVLVKSLDIPDGIEECCQTFVCGKQKMIDVTSVAVADPETRLSLPIRIFLNAGLIKQHNRTRIIPTKYFVLGILYITLLYTEVKLMEF